MADEGAAPESETRPDRRKLVKTIVGWLLALVVIAGLVYGGLAYRTRLELGLADAIAPLAAPTSPVRAADLLP